MFDVLSYIILSLVQLYWSCVMPLCHTQSNISLSDVAAVSWTELLYTIHSGLTTIMIDV